MERLRLALRLSRAAAAPQPVAAVLAGSLYAVHDARPFRALPILLALAAGGFAFLGASVLRDTLDAVFAEPARIDGNDLPALLARGEVPPAEALGLAGAWWLLAFLAAGAVAPLSGARTLFLTVGAAALSALYAAPPVSLRRLGRGLGEGAAFAGLGLVPFAMGYASQTGETTFGVCLAALPAGCWGAALSLAADLDHLDDDARSGRLSTAVGLGAGPSRSVVTLLAVGSILALAVAVRLGELPPAALAAAAAPAPLVFALVRPRPASPTLAGPAVASGVLCNVLIAAGVLIEKAGRG